MILQFDSYRPFLKSVLAEKQRKNAGYSMRAFAKNVGLTQSAVSQVFSGKKNLSLDSARRIAACLGLSESETEYFCLLVQFDAAKTASAKESLWQRIQSFHSGRDRYELGLEFFRVISDWWHIPIRNMTELKGLEFTGTQIGARLGISRLDAEIAIDRLVRLGLLAPDEKKAGKFKKTKASFVAQSTSPNEALRKFHRQMLQKAIDALETQSPQEKMIGSETLAISPSQIPEATAIAEEFFQKMLALEKKAKEKTEVYHLGVQFFNLTAKKKVLRHEN